MEENRANPKKSRTKSCFSKSENRSELVVFQQVRSGLVYLSGESRPSLAEYRALVPPSKVYLSGESRPSLAERLLRNGHQ